MNKVSAAVVGASAYLLLPVLVFAQNTDPKLGNLETLLESIGDLINLATPIVIGLALLAFFWGLVKFIFASSDDDKKSGKSFMIGGIIALFVMIAIVGIVKFIASAFGVETGGDLPVPGVEVVETDND
ncbi:MAG: hypothetical protein QG633_304 [Patescibacteria group bacterium]|jgi:hypothetical protein|nr:hypothetical protein [Patescibacteria group bacterium]